MALIRPLHGPGPPSPASPSDSGQPGTSTRALVVAVVMIGVLMAAVDTTIVVLALPAMQRSLHMTLSSVVWVIIAYILVVTVLATQVGRLGDMFGRSRMYQLGFLVFVVGSALCATATGELTIVLYRVLQGVGGAFLTANSGAVLADAFPREERGRAFGYNSIGWNVGAILGILLGGVIITYVSWRWIFWINIPAGIVALAISWRALPVTRPDQRERLDLAGMVLLGTGLFGLLWGMTQLATSRLSPAILVYLVAGALALCGFLAAERRQRSPMVDLALFRIPTFTPTLLAALFQAVANFAVLFLVLMYLQGVRQLSPLHASLLLVPGYLVGGVIGPYCGRLSDKVGAVWPATLGLGAQIVALFVYAHLRPGTPLWMVTLAAVINGIGAGAFIPANNSVVMKLAPGREFGTAFGLLRTFGNVGMVFSFAVAVLVAARAISRHLAFAIFLGTTTLPKRLGPVFTTGLRAAFYSSMAFMALAMVLSATRVLGRGRLGPGRDAPGARVQGST